MHARAASSRACHPRPRPILTPRLKRARAATVPTSSSTTGVVGDAAAPAPPSASSADAAAAAAPAAATPTHPNPPASELVDQVLAAVAGSDGGVDLPADRRDAVDALLDRLASSQYGASATPRPLDDPLLIGDYVVSYTSTSRAQGERGQPAGGRFRSRLGRLLFRTTGVFQSVLPLPEGEGEGGGGAAPQAVALAVNKVSFRLLGLIPGYVGLRGRCYPCPRPRLTPDAQKQQQQQQQEEHDDRSTVRVLFERPVLSLGPLTARIGPPSSVVLTTTYLDERVRLGRGSRGSLFVFSRGGAASQARMAEVGTERPSAAGRLALLLALAAMVAAGAWLWRAGAPLAAAGVWLVAAGLAAITYQGGIERDDDDIARAGAAGTPISGKAASAAA